MKTILYYIKCNLFKIVYAAIIISISAFIMIAYNIPILGVLYFLILTTIFSTIWFMFGFIKSYNKCKDLQDIIENINCSIDELPEINSTYSKYYETIIKKLKEDNTKILTNNKQMFERTINYYSLWVHQIKTPISSMKLKLQNEDTEYSRNMQRDLKNIERYVNMAISYLKLNSDINDFKFKNIQIDEIIKPIIKSYSSDFIYKKIKLNYSSLNTEITTDEKWLAFVVEQILSNAIKYTKSGEISIYMENKTLIIKDTGIGISNEDLPRIFEKGFTGENGRIDKSATGIGLYLCKKTCKSLGHLLSIESIINIGTKAKITFQNPIALY